MKEVEIWEYVLKWGLAKNSTLISDPSNWSDDDFKAMKNTLQHCLPLIRFFCLSSKEFLQKVHPYKKLFKHRLYEDILISTDNISLPRNIEIDSKIVNFNIVSTISKHIDKMNISENIKFTHIRELYLPYKFQLLLRGSEDGFTPKKFHELCDNKSKTVTFIKVKGTGEILGRYNPIIWKTSDFQGNFGKTKDSFIFSFKNKNDFKDAIVSNVKDEYGALFYHTKNGPTFGGDIVIEALNEYADYGIIYCNKDCYERRIRDTENEFSIEDYEVYQIEKK